MESKGSLDVLTVLNTVHWLIAVDPRKQLKNDCYRARLFWIAVMAIAVARTWLLLACANAASWLAPCLTMVRTMSRFSLGQDSEAVHARRPTLRRPLSSLSATLTEHEM